MPQNSYSLSYDPRMQVKQYVAQIRNSRGRRFRVFETGDPKFWLFCAIVDGIDTGLHFPIRKTDLNREISSALRHGWGNC